MKIRQGIAVFVLCCCAAFLFPSCETISIGAVSEIATALLLALFPSSTNVPVKSGGEDDDDDEGGSGGTGTAPPPPQGNTEFIKKVNFTGNTATVTFNNLRGNTVYLVKINKSDSVVPAANTGGPPNLAQGLMGFSGSRRSVNIVDNPASTESDRIRAFNANPPNVVYARNPLSLASRAAAFVPPAVGATRKFWVGEKEYDSAPWIQKQATLRATGKYGNIWVLDECYSAVDGGKSDKKITSAQAKALSDKFDLIYPVETNLIGFEYGGGPGGDWGKDGDPKIQILIHDTNFSCGGYFWSKDYYTQADLDKWGWDVKTNLAEIFYLDVTQFEIAPDYAYSALAHEFQHMINFNMKFVKHQKNSASWYNEMLSELAEDVISPLIGVGPENVMHPIQVRVNAFLETYNQVGITEWRGLQSAAYAKGFAFGAYLMRNYGGPELLGKILANNTTNIESITAALNEIQPGLTFETVLERFGEALVFSGSSMPGNALSFDKTVAKTLNGTKYTAYGFDIWNRPAPNNSGPKIFGLSQTEMRPRSVLVHSADAWKNKSGNFSVTLEKPNDPGIILYLMVR
jgi:hypothetical protein